MTIPYLESAYARKLAHAYVALALAQDEAKRYASEHSAHVALCPLLTSLDVTAELLEEILEGPSPEAVSTQSQPMTCSDMLM
ncbi:MAG: hypothetical protein H0T77_03000 [Pyrinomonadaceae bacterium]|nr:hypothetical protein [Pyrinomonadaceae bacterium]